MARGTPDWSLPEQDIHILREDLAELAARLTCIQTYDRRGSIVWMDDFSKGKGAWRSTASGTGAAVELCTDYPHWPPFCVKLTGGSDGGRTATLDRYLSGSGKGTLGIEVSVAFTSDFDQFEITLWYADGMTSHYARVGLDDVDDQIYYRDASVAKQNIAALSVGKTAFPKWNTLKMVMDPDTNQYDRLMLNGTTHDISAYSFLNGAISAAPFILLVIQHKSRSGENDYCYVDGVVITQGEA